MLQKGVGQQLSSFKTTVREVELLPHWCEVKINASGMRLAKRREMAWTSDLRQANYDAGRFFVSLLNSYIEFGMRPTIRLSAGMDSRCTLAAMLCGNDQYNLDVISVQTFDYLKFEQRIVERMMPLLPFHMANFIQRIGGPTNWTDWKRLYLGSQSQIARYPEFGSPFPMYSGACGELARVFYSWGGSTDGIELHPYFTSDIADEVISDISESLDRFDGQCKDFCTPENIHYQMFRNRFHFGRTASESIMNFPPLVYAFLSNGTGSGNADPLHRLIFELGGEQILRHPFDEPGKEYSGPIRKGWERIQIPRSDFFAREIFAGGISSSLGYSDRDRDQAVSRVGGLHQELVGRDFLQESEEAIFIVERHACLSELVVKRARKELQILTDGGDSVTPMLAPALLAVLSINMAITEH